MSTRFISAHMQIFNVLYFNFSTHLLITNLLKWIGRSVMSIFRKEISVCIFGLFQTSNLISRCVWRPKTVYRHLGSFGKFSSRKWEPSIFPRIASGVLSGVQFGVVSWVLSGVLFGVLFWVLSGVLSGVLCGVLRLGLGLGLEVRVRTRVRG